MAHPPTIGVVADDLTSATDGAAPFLARGTVPVVLRRPSLPPAAIVAAIDTGSRAAAVEAAVAATREAITALAGAPILYKTIDSTLRGWIREEIAAALDTSGRPRLIVAPAFPEAGRVTVGGRQYVHGVPVDESAYGRDPVHPARTSSVPDLLAGLGRPVRVLPRDASDDVIRAARHAPVTVLDADSQAALNRIVALVPDAHEVLWVGSPGLAQALAARLPADHGETPARLRARRVLVVAGSANPATHAQCDALAANGIPVVTGWSGTPTDHPVLCLRAPTDRRGEAGTVLDALAEDAVAAFRAGAFDALVATGGETMAALLDRIGVGHFALAGEIGPGFPLGIAATAAGSLAIAMKAGGFGAPDSLLAAVRHLLDQHEAGDHES